MSVLASIMKGFRLSVGTLLLSMLPLQAHAQQAAPVPTPVSTPVLTLDQERLFRESAWGRATLSQLEAEVEALAAENRGIEAQLEAEERSLTERRAGMAPEAFAPLADAFDGKVQGIRRAQDAKGRALSRQVEESRARFDQTVLPLLTGLMEEHGAVVILADAAVILSLSAIDVTDAAIARADQLMPPPAVEGGATPSAEPGVSPAPGAAVAPETPPAP